MATVQLMIIFIFCCVSYFSISFPVSFVKYHKVEKLPVTIFHAFLKLLVCLTNSPKPNEAKPDIWEAETRVCFHFCLKNDQLSTSVDQSPFHLLLAAAVVLVKAYIHISEWFKRKVHDDIRRVMLKNSTAISSLRNHDKITHRSCSE